METKPFQHAKKNKHRLSEMQEQYDMTDFGVVSHADPNNFHSTYNVDDDEDVMSFDYDHQDEEEEEQESAAINLDHEMSRFPAETKHAHSYSDDPYKNKRSWEEQEEEHRKESVDESHSTLSHTPHPSQANQSKRLKTETDPTDATVASTVSSNPPNKQWNVMFERLKAYKEKYGDTLVPKRFNEDPKLGTWVETQRVQYKRLQREVDTTSGIEAVQPNKRLDHERLAKLESIGFAWSAKHVRKNNGNKVTGAAASSYSVAPALSRKSSTTSDHKEKNSRSGESQWEEMFQRLVEYKDMNGDCLVPRKFDQDPKLAAWVESQRVLWNRALRLGASGAAKHSRYQNDGSALLLPDPPPDVTNEFGAEEDYNDWSAEEATEEDAAELVATMAEADDAILAAAEIAAVEAMDALATAPTVHSKPGDAKPSSASKTAVLTQERKDRLTALGFVWSLRTKRIEDHWDEMFRQLVGYKNKHGDCLVPSRYETNLKLGKWVETQRYEYTKLQRTNSFSSVKTDGSDIVSAPSSKPRATNPRLTEERLRRLESIGFEWKVRNKMKRYYDKQWQDMFERLLKFKEETGHCVVPKRFPPDLKLGTWVHTQRIQYRKLVHKESKKSGSGDTASDGNGSDENVMSAVPKGEEMSYRLTDERRKRLEEVGFVWSARENETKTEQQAPPRVNRNSYDDLWDANYARLVAFKESYGHCLVPKRYKPDPKLGTWVDTQRVQYKKAKGKEKEIDYDPTIDIVSNAEATGATLAPGFAGPIKPPVGRLTEERIQRLERLGFVWSLRDDWMKHYEELKSYKEQFGNCNVPARYTANRRLGIWVSAQRQQYKFLKQQTSFASVAAASTTVVPVVDGFEGVGGSKKQRAASLTTERINLLNQLGFTWTIRSRDSLGESWNLRLADLIKYKEQHGNCLVPSRYLPNPELGVWVGTQRTQYRLYQRAKESGQQVGGASAMNDERIRQLEDLGFVWALRGAEGKETRKDTLSLDETGTDPSVDGEQELMEHVLAI